MLAHNIAYSMIKNTDGLIMFLFWFKIYKICCIYVAFTDEPKLFGRDVCNRIRIIKIVYDYSCTADYTMQAPGRNCF